MTAIRHVTTSADDILGRLDELRAADAPTHGGRVLSYVYDSGLAELDELAARAVRAVQPVNGLDPTTFSSVATLERELRRIRARPRARRRRMSWAPSRPAAPRAACSPSRPRATCGSRRTAGSRARLDRGWSPRPRCTRRSRRRRTTSGSSSTWCPSTTTGAVAASAIAARLADDVALVVVSAPSYPFAALDPVGEVAALCAGRDIPLHVDACIGGLVLPFWPGLPAWDFAVPGVTSISADLHKFGYAPEGRLGAAAARTRPPAHAVLRDHALARLSGGESDDPRIEVGGTARGGLGDHRGARRSRIRRARRVVPALDAGAARGDRRHPGTAGRRGRRSGRCSRSPPTSRCRPPSRSTRTTGRMPRAAPGGCCSCSRRSRSPTDRCCRRRRTSRSRRSPKACCPTCVPALVAAADAVRGVPHVDPTAAARACCRRSTAASIRRRRGRCCRASESGETAGGLPDQLAPLLALIEVAARRRSPSGC